MTQERLTDLATIALEGDMLDKIDYVSIIEDFISKNTKRMMMFNLANRAIPDKAEALCK
ncbi:hypothetical protein E2562_025329, partial [Oryza meyeriana var. granulata]